MVILGLSLSSDTHASLLIDGEIRSCIGEERLTRQKNFIGLPYLAIKEVLELESLSGDDIDLVTVGFEGYLEVKDKVDIDVLLGRRDQIDFSNEKPWWYRKEKIKSSLYSDLRRLFGLKDNRKNFGEFLKEELRKLGITAPIQTVDHHTAHAMSAYYFSNKKKNLVITADGYGDGLSSAVYIGDNGNLSQIFCTDDKNSLGVLYAAATKFLGYKSHKHEGKLTGLAAFGDPEKVSKELHKIAIYNRETHAFEFDFKKLNCSKLPIINRILYYKDMITGSYLPGALTRSLLKYYGKISKGLTNEDIAAGTQKFFEDMYVKHVRAMIKQTEITDLALAGGNFGNVKLNQRLLQETGATSIFIHPNMGDGGTAIGSAAYCYVEQQQKEADYKYEPRRLKHVYLGTGVDVKELLDVSKIRGYRIHKCKNTSKEAAQLLADGFIIGRLSGKMEYGPRSLGNRSIIAHPFNKDINNEVNKRLSRTEFMPFAPSVLKEKADIYYKGSKEAEYAAEFMTITLDVKEEGRIAEAVNHVDNTARPHFVDDNNNPEYADLLREFGKISGHPILINTSFNRHEEPIIRSATDGLDRLEDESVHYLLAEDYIISKAKEPISYIGSIPKLED